jgi:hypothetical protein
MDFIDVYEELKKYPFVEKMLMCQMNATRIMKHDHIDVLDRRKDMIYPWELETFAELSLLSEGNRSTKSFNFSGQTEFTNMINAIRQYIHPHLEQKRETPEFAYDYIMVTGLLQFKVQENILIRLYRYKYFFNFINENINMKNEFASVFNGLQYNDL